MINIFGKRVSKWVLIYITGDIICYLLSIVIALYINAITSLAPMKFLIDFSFKLILIGFTYFIILYIADMYDQQLDFRRPINLAKIFLSSWIGTIVVMVIYYFPLGSFVGRTLLIIQAVAFSLLLCLWRFGFSAIALPQRLQTRILIVGAGRAGRRLLHTIRLRSGWGLLPVGFVDDDQKKTGATVDGLPVLGDSARLTEIIQEHQIAITAVAITDNKSERLLNHLVQVSWNGCQLIDMPTFYESLTGKLPTAHISNDWVLQWNLNDSRIYYKRIKRLIDLVLAIFSLAISWPVFLLIALIIKVDSPGPVIFKQERLGQDGRCFNILKFRTMHQDASGNGPYWTTNNDPRITRVGRFIRKLRLDELPQLINILKGDMSFIGPRPLIACDLRDQIPYYNYRLLVKPGLTGWAQVTYPDGLAIDSLPEKVKYDLFYIKNIGFLLDMAILLKTVRIVLFGRGG